MTPLPDHQMTPQHETSNPTEDHQSTSTTKITEPITPRHHDPMEINDSVADAPSALIWAAVGGSTRRRAAAAATPTLPAAVGSGGVSC